VSAMHKYLVLLLVLAAAACGGGGNDDDTTATESVPEIPETLTAEQLACPLDAFMVNAVTGLDVGDADPIIQTGDGVSCTFSANGGETGIGVTTYGSTGSVALERLVELVDDPESVDLDFADDAVWSPGLTTLHALRGDAAVQVQITDFAGALADPLQVATELAEIALEG